MVWASEGEISTEKYPRLLKKIFPTFSRGVRRWKLDGKENYWRAKSRFPYLYGLTFVSLFELEILLAIELHSPWKINFQLGNLFCLYFIFVDITKPRERRESWAISEIAKVALLSEKAMSIHNSSVGNIIWNTNVTGGWDKSLGE